MKKILFLVSIAVLLSTSTFPQRNPLTYIESSAGLSSPEWDGGDSELEFADINGDGHPDIVSIGDHGSPFINTDEHGIMVYLNDGTGSWNVLMDGNFGYGGIAIGDVNNDGHLDAGYGMHHNYSGTDLGDQLIEVALGNSTGTGWIPWDDGLATAGEEWGMFGTDFGDIDNDGDLDIGSNSFGCCNGIHVYLNNLDGTWTHSYGYSGGNSSDIFEFGDINNDGFLDIATAYQNGTVYFGDGTGDFTPMDQNLPPAGSVGRVGVCLGDVDGDGGMDLAFADYDGGVYVYVWKDDEELWESWSEGLPTAGTTQLLQLCDMNSDGDMDLASFGEAHFQLWLGDGEGNWTADASFTTQTSGDGHAFRAGGDVDHNGKPDMVILVEIGDWISYQNYLKCFRETSPVFTLNIKPVFPHGHEFFWQNCIRDIRWTSAVPTGAESTVKLEYSVTGKDGPWNLISNDLPNNGRYQWLVPLENSLDCYIRYTAMTDNDTTSSITQAAFTISDGTARIENPSKYYDPVKIFPNPAINSISVVFDQDYYTSPVNSVIILDITGREYCHKKGLMKSPLIIDISDLEPGLYFFRIFSSDQKVISRKFIKK